MKASGSWAEHRHVEKMLEQSAKMTKGYLDLGQDCEEKVQVISSHVAFSSLISAFDSPDRGEDREHRSHPEPALPLGKSPFPRAEGQALPRSRSLFSWKRVPRIRIAFFESSGTSQGPVSLS